MIFWAYGSITRNEVLKPDWEEYPIVQSIPDSASGRELFVKEWIASKIRIIHIKCQIGEDGFRAFCIANNLVAITGEEKYANMLYFYKLEKAWWTPPEIDYDKPVNIYANYSSAVKYILAAHNDGVMYCMDLSLKEE